MGHQACKPLTSRSAPRKDGTTIWILLQVSTDRGSGTLFLMPTTESCRSFAPTWLTTHILERNSITRDYRQLGRAPHEAKPGQV